MFTVISTPKLTLYCSLPSDGIFGSHLQSVCDREKVIVPRFVRDCIQAVDERGRSLLNRTQHVGVGVCARTWMHTLECMHIPPKTHTHIHTYTHTLFS